MTREQHAAIEQLSDSKAPALFTPAGSIDPVKQYVCFGYRTVSSLGSGAASTLHVGGTGHRFKP